MSTRASVYMRTLRAAPLWHTSTRSLPRSSYPAAPSFLTTTIAASTPFRSQSRTMSDMTPIISKGAAPPAGPYSHAIKTPTAIYCSGQIPADAAGNLVEGDIGKKTAACLQNLKAILVEAGSDLDKVVKANIFLSDMSHFAEMNKEYTKWLPHKPARSCVAVKTLPLNVEVEIEAIALP